MCSTVSRSRAASGSVGTSPVSDKLSELGAALGLVDRAVVAFSGGADSSLVARVATDVLGPERVLCVTAISASLAPEELADCRALAQEWGLRWRTVWTGELDDPEYVANGTDRCYHCKASLLGALAPLAEADSAVVLLGVNLDDLGDHRPGQRAAAERGARFPLVDARLTKDDVRAVSRHLGLRTWDKPAAACLASRLPYGTPVTLATLATVSGAESALRALGFRQVRVRHYGDLARIELEPDDLSTAVARRAELVAAVRDAGYRYITLDLEGFRSGNLNGALAPERGSTDGAWTSTGTAP
jgi:pyridinium-3,5-biscarboxylic acid mononucleotide sulfurtransferase